MCPAAGAQAPPTTQGGPAGLGHGTTARVSFAEEAVNEVKRQAMSELQKAVSDAERKAHELISTERAKMERALAEARRQASEDALTVVNQQEDSSEVRPPARPPLRPQPLVQAPNPPSVASPPHDLRQPAKWVLWCPRRADVDPEGSRGRWLALGRAPGCHGHYSDLGWQAPSPCFC